MTALLFGQNVLTVTDIRYKIEFQSAGLENGYLPVCMVREEVQSRQLVETQTLETKLGVSVFLDCRSVGCGKALRRFNGWLEDRKIATASWTEVLLPPAIRCKGWRQSYL